MAASTVVSLTETNELYKKTGAATYKLTRIVIILTEIINVFQPKASGSWAGCFCGTGGLEVEVLQQKLGTCHSHHVSWLLGQF
jgi:hypothetical protein